jgi:hypothetical protein
VGILKLMPSPTRLSMSSAAPAEVRTHLLDALQLDLVGPAPDDLAHAEEIIPQPPSKWYLTGFLVPSWFG